MGTRLNMKRPGPCVSWIWEESGIFYWKIGSSPRSYTSFSMMMLPPNKSAAASGRPAAVAVGLCPSDESVYYCCCASHARFNVYCVEVAVLCAGTAFHAPAGIYRYGFAVLHYKYLMGADLNTSAAAGAFLSIKTECIWIFKVFHR